MFPRSIRFGWETEPTGPGTTSFFGGAGDFTVGGFCLADCRRLIANYELTWHSHFKICYNFPKNRKL